MDFKLLQEIKVSGQVVPLWQPYDPGSNGFVSTLAIDYEGPVEAGTLMQVVSYRPEKEMQTCSWVSEADRFQMYIEVPTELLERTTKRAPHSFPVTLKGQDGELVRTQFVVEDGNPYGAKQPEEDDGA